MKSNLKYAMIALGALIIVSLIVCGGLVIPAAAASSYYVDCSAGTNGDGSQSSPWNNIASVNATTFAAGDSILFARGTTCSGSLQPGGSGASGSPITIGAYGTGARPIIDGGTNEAALKLYDQEYWDITGIEVTGGTTFGILVDGSGAGPLTHFEVTDVVVHDVFGGPMLEKSTGLIVFGYAWGQQLNDVLVDGALVYNTDQWSGVVITAKDWGRVLATRSTNVTFRNITAHDVYGDGIIQFSVTNGLIEHSVTYETGNEPVETIGTPNAIWTWDCDNCIVQFTEAYLAASPGWDGGAYDIDYYGADNIVQYNYGHDNDAYCYAVFSTKGTVPDSTIRYNVCSNNARNPDLASDRNADMYIAVWENGKISGMHIHNNTHYWNPANTTDHYAITFYDLWRGCCYEGANEFMNNIVYSDNKNLVKMMDTGIVMDYNLYWYTGTEDPIFYWGRRKYTGFAAWHSGSGQDAHGMYADPLLNSPTYHGVGFPTTEFTLQSGSPAIDAGLDMAAAGYVTSMGAQDFYGNSIPANGVYDIGAYEYGGGPPPPTDTPAPTDTPGGPTDTPVPPTDTPEPQPTDTPGAGGTMHVGDITMGCGSLGVNHFALATVTILDASDQPVDTATVYGTFTGASSGGASGDTAGDGTVTLQSPNKKNGGTWTFTVDDVVKSGWTYDEGANVETSDSITCP